MQKDKRRIRLLHRVVRLREVEKRKAAVRLADAQGLHGKLLALQDRSGTIAASYSARRDAATGTDLAQQLQFTAGLEGIRDFTAAQTRKAEAGTRAALSQLRMADHRHEITAQTLSAQQRAAESQAEKRDTAHLARKLKGSA